MYASVVITNIQTHYAFCFFSVGRENCTHDVCAVKDLFTSLHILALTKEENALFIRSASALRTWLFKRMLLLRSLCACVRVMRSKTDTEWKCLRSQFHVKYPACTHKNACDEFNPNMVHSEGSKEDESVQILKFIYTFRSCWHSKDSIMACSVYSKAPFTPQKLLSFMSTSHWEFFSQYFKVTAEARIGYLRPLQFLPAANRSQRLHHFYSIWPNQ